METWRATNPDWRLELLHRDTVRDWISPLHLPSRWHELPGSPASDSVRLSLLARYGGVWMDISIMLFESLDRLAWSQIEAGAQLVAFYSPWCTPHETGREHLETWFLATRAHNPFIVHWRDLYIELMHDKVSVSGNLAHPLLRDVDLSAMLHEGVDFCEYLSPYTLVRRILQTEPILRAQWERWPLISSEHTGFRWVFRHGWSEEPNVAALLGDDPDEDRWLAETPLLKFIHAGGSLQRVPREELLNPNRVIGRLFRRAGVVR